MHDLSQFRANLDAYAERLATRGFQFDVAQFRAMDSERRAAVTETEQLKAQRNAESQEISKLKKQNVDTSERQQAVRAMRNQYLLAYRPPDDNQPGKWHRIRVKLNVAHTNVYARYGYYSE